VPDIVLMDIGLPGMNGLELTRKLKADPRFRALPIIAFTAYAMKGDDLRASQAGCDGYITKPIDTGALANQIEQLLRPRAADTSP
jgi:CheY-like chemotaxis protein